MGYKLWELANRDGVIGLLPHVEDAVLNIAENFPSSAISTLVPNDVGEPLARYIHGTIFAKARPLRKTDPQPPNPVYSHIAFPTEREAREPFGELSANRIIAKAAGGTLSPVGAQRLASSVVRQLTYHNLLRSTHGTGVAAYWIRPWPASTKWEHLPHQPIDAKVEKRIKEESDTPVIVAYSSKAIVGTLPEEIGPERAVEKIVKLSQAFDVLAIKYSEVKGQFHEVKAELEKLQAEIEAAKVDPTKAAWEAARARIDAVLHPESVSA